MRLAFDTERLSARPFQDRDAPAVAAMASDFEVAKMTALIPHPYGVESAQGWILTHWGRRRRRLDYSFAVTLKRTGEVMGSASVFKRPGAQAWEIGYMLGKAYWGRGYATEAARGVILWARDQLGADEITAGYFDGNLASAQVLKKLGFHSTGGRHPAYSVARGASVDCVELVLPANAAVGEPTALKDAG